MERPLILHRRPFCFGARFFMRGSGVPVAVNACACYLPRRTPSQTCRAAVPGFLPNQCRSMRGAFLCACLLCILRFFVRVVEAPISEQIPIFAQRFRRVHGAARAVAAGHGVGGTVAVAAPADAFWVFRVEGKLLGLAVCLMSC